MTGQIDDFASLKSYIEHNKAPTTGFLVNIDYLMIINDLYGHDFGDSLILEVKELLEEFHANHPEYHLFHDGRDEFFLISAYLGNNPTRHAQTIVESFEALGIPFCCQKMSQKQKAVSTVSVGVIVIDNTGVFSTFIDALKESLYRAKKHKPSGVHVLDMLTNPVPRQNRNPGS